MSDTDRIVGDSPPMARRTVLLSIIVCVVLGLLYAVLNQRRYDSPLHEACVNGDIAEARKLVAAGADVNAQGPGRRDDTPLMLAIGADGNRLALVTLLLDHGANPTLADSNGRTALDIAALYDANDTIPVLVAHGANVNARDKAGHSVLDYVGTIWAKDHPTRLLLEKYGAK